MKRLLVVIFVLIPFLSFCQNRGVKFELSPGIYLSGSVGEFNPYRHKIDTCIEGEVKFICRIDGKKVFGIDRGIELPETELFSLSIEINGRKIPLDVSGMFNPTFTGGLSSGEFQLTKTRNVYILKSHFSDGAGTYIAKWKIFNYRSQRILISNDEKYFSE